MIINHYQEVTGGEFPGGPVVRTPRFHRQGLDWISGWGAKILQAARCDQKKKKSNWKQP